MKLSKVQLTTTNVLFIRIPWKQDGRHVIEVEGNFQSANGVEVHVANPFNAEISRIRELTLTDKKFRFEDLGLNQTGYDFYIWLNDTDFRVVEATPLAEFKVADRTFVASETPTFAPVFESQ